MASQKLKAKVQASERNASALAISQRAQPKLNNEVVNSLIDTAKSRFSESESSLFELSRA